MLKYACKLCYGKGETEAVKGPCPRCHGKLFEPGVLKQDKHYAKLRNPHLLDDFLGDMR